MLYIKKRQKNQQVEPARLEEEGDLEVVQVLNETIVDISSIKIGLPKNLIQEESKHQIKLTLTEIHKQFGAKIPTLHPVKDMKINNEDLDKNLKKLEKTELLRSEQVKSLKGNVEEQISKFKEKQKFIQTCKYLK